MVCREPAYFASFQFGNPVTCISSYHLVKNRRGEVFQTLNELLWLFQALVALISGLCNFELYVCCTTLIHPHTIKINHKGLLYHAIYTLQMHMHMHARVCVCVFYLTRGLQKRLGALHCDFIHSKSSLVMILPQGMLSVSPLEWH